MSEPAAPRVSVVLIVFNDETRLPEAIGSARTQSLTDIEIVIVDHGSTDASRAIAEQAATEDPRISVIALPDNAGKPGRPINAGIAAARAPWVTVFASDDVLRPKACKAMLTAAERHGADLVIGGLQRVDVDSGRSTRWMPGVTGRDRVITSIDQLPELLRDTTGGGKLYNTAFVRSHGLTFPEDIYYQDQVFTLEYLASADVVAIVSQFVLDWRHWPTSGRQSVTQRKLTVENLADRFRANTMIDSFLKERDRIDLLVRKQQKFLIHDLNIHVKGAGDADPEYRETLVSAAREYLASFDPRAFEGLPLAKRLMTNCLLAGRTVEAEQITNTSYPRLLAEWGRARVGDRTYLVPPWSAGDQPGDPVFDVSDYRLDDIPVRFRPIRTRLSMDRHRSALRFEVRVAAHDRPPAALRLHLLQPDTGCRLAVPLSGGKDGAGDAGVAGTYNATVRGSVLDRTFAAAHPVALHVVGDEGRPSGWSASAHPFDDATGAPEDAGVGGDRPWRAVTNGSSLVLEREDPKPGPRRPWSRAAPVPEPDPAEVLTLGQARRFLAETPIRPARDRVFFESFAGKRVSEGPLVISRRIAERRRRVRQTWSYTGSTLLDVPPFAEPAPRFSIRYLEALAAAAVWFDNGWLPFRPAGGQRLIQLWRGAPIVRPRVGGDSPTWREYVSSGPYFETFVGELSPHSFPIRVGAPRTDPLLVPGADRRRTELRRAWGIDDRTVVLWSPVLRDGDVSPEYRQPDLHRIAGELGPDWWWFRREHDDDATGRRTSSIPEDLRWFAAGTGARTELTDLMLMADVLVTDYASAAADFGITERPVIHYVSDQRSFETGTPGTLFSLTDSAAGSVVTDDEALLSALRTHSLGPDPDGASRSWTEELAPLDLNPRSADDLLDILGY